MLPEFEHFLRERYALANAAHFSPEVILNAGMFKHKRYQFVTIESFVL